MEVERLEWLRQLQENISFGTRAKLSELYSSLQTLYLNEINELSIHDLKNFNKQTYHEKIKDRVQNDFAEVSKDLIEYDTLFIANILNNRAKERHISETAEIPANTSVSDRETYCLPSCSEKEASNKDMIQCSHCWKWFHLSCINLEKKCKVGIFSCPLCCLMPQLVKEISEEVLNLKAIMKDSLMFNKQLIQQLCSKNVEHERLKLENQQLRDRISDLSKASHKKAWETFTASKSTLLIGSSITRDIVVKPECESIESVSISGGRIKDVTDELKKRQNKHSRVILQVGCNDIVSNDSEEDIIRNYRGLIKTAKTVSTEKKVLVSAILPRHDKDDLGDKVHALNAGLQVLAGEEECDFQDHKAFYLSDGSVNDGYYLADKIHLSAAGSRRLLSDLDLKEELNYMSSKRYPSKYKSVQVEKFLPKKHVIPQRKSTGRQINRYPPHQDDRGYQGYRDRHDQNRNNFDHQRSFNNVCCDFCGEDGHVSSVCRHGKPISCYKCGIQGHKEKKCESRPY